MAIGESVVLGTELAELKYESVSRYTRNTTRSCRRVQIMSSCDTSLDYIRF